MSEHRWVSAVEQEVFWALQRWLLRLLSLLLLLLPLLLWLWDGGARPTPERVDRCAGGNVKAREGWAHHTSADAGGAGDECVAAQQQQHLP